jgi:hypothetical protein
VARIGYFAIGNRRLVCIGTLSLSQLRQTEIEDLSPAIFGEKEVFGFEIAMDDSRVAGSRQATSDLFSNVQHFMQPHRAATETITQGLASQQFRDNIRCTCVLAQMKDRDDIRMIQGCGGLSLEFEST